MRPIHLSCCARSGAAGEGEAGERALGPGAGGARSGKSRFAEGLALGHAGARVYIATAQPGDEEMAARIAAHKDRRGSEWSTVEAPIGLVEALETVADGFVLIDCLTLWISNLLLGRLDIAPRVERLAEALRARPGHRRRGFQRGRPVDRAGQRAGPPVSRRGGAGQPAPGASLRRGGVRGRRPAAEAQRDLAMSMTHAEDSLDWLDGLTGIALDETARRSPARPSWPCSSAFRWRSL
jgi:hypothetical protein